jgi:6-phosphofructokinase 1
MGRHAGFLTAAAALARVFPDDGPHLIYLPERPFSMDKFVADVKGVYEKYKRCVIAVSEGISDEKGVAIAAKFTKEVDSHGNVQLSGSGALGDVLAKEIKDKAQISRVRADTFGYLQRSFAGVVSANDAKEARTVGGLAVKYATGGKWENGSTAIKRKPGKKYSVYFERTELRNVAKETRHVPDEFINKDGNDVTKAFIDYARPIVGELPPIGRFKGVPVKKG